MHDPPRPQPLFVIGTMAFLSGCEREAATPDDIYFLVGATAMGYEEALEGWAGRGVDQIGLGRGSPDLPAGSRSSRFG